jgi:hypothetical protein
MESSIDTLVSVLMAISIAASLIAAAVTGFKELRRARSDSLRVTLELLNSTQEDLRKAKRKVAVLERAMREATRVLSKIVILRQKCFGELDELLNDPMVEEKANGIMGRYIAAIEELQGQLDAFIVEATMNGLDKGGDS